MNWRTSCEQACPASRNLSGGEAVRNHQEDDTVKRLVPKIISGEQAGPVLQGLTDGAEYEAWIRQAKINQFGKHVEVLEEQYIDKQQPKPFTENSGDFSGAVYRHRLTTSP